MSAITSPPPCALTDSAASKTTAAGSLPIWCATTRIPSFSPCMESWDTAAARNVSLALRTMFCAPALLCIKAIFAALVVFPTPFTPSSIQTLVFPSWTCRRHSLAKGSSASFSFSNMPFWSKIFSFLQAASRQSINSIAFFAPTSPSMRASAKSSKKASLSAERPEKRLFILSAKETFITTPR